MTEAVILALVAILGTVITALFKLLKDNTKATSANTSALKAIAAETKKGNEQSANRNGHLGELIVKQGEQTQAIVDGAVGQIVDKVQHVKKQEVENQIVNNTK